MQRKLYFLVVFFLLNSISWGWSAYHAKIGGQQAFPYQSSNPTVELKTTRNINQAQSSECYLFAYTGALEVANKNAWNRPSHPELSAEYLFIQKLYAWSKEVLLNDSTLTDSFYFLEGGDVHHAMKLSIEEGLLPQEHFKPRNDFSNWDFVLLYKDLKEIVKEGRKAIKRAPDDKLRNQIYQSFMQKVKERIEFEAGPQVTNFSWGGKDWSVRQFENSFGIKRNSHIYLMYAQGQWDMGDPWDLRKAVLEMAKAFRGAFNHRQTTWSQIWQYLIGSVDKGLPAMLSVKWAGTYHVLNVVGYEFNNRSEIVSFKLKNSWGNEYGDQGHAYFGLQDIQKHTTSVWGFKAP